MENVVREVVSSHTDLGVSKWELSATLHCIPPQPGHQATAQKVTEQRPWMRGSGKEARKESRTSGNAILHNENGIYFLDCLLGRSGGSRGGDGGCVPDNNIKLKRREIAMQE